MEPPGTEEAKLLKWMDAWSANTKYHLADHERQCCQQCGINNMKYMCNAAMPTYLWSPINRCLGYCSRYGCSIAAASATIFGAKFGLRMDAFGNRSLLMAATSLFAGGVWDDLAPTPHSAAPAAYSPDRSPTHPHARLMCPPNAPDPPGPPDPPDQPNHPSTRTCLPISIAVITDRIIHGRRSGGVELRHHILLSFRVISPGLASGGGAA